MVPINEKLFDDSGFVLLDGTEPPPSKPSTVGVLLARLGVRRASLADQEHAITAWLAENKPAGSLAGSLERRGFGHLL